MIDVGAGVTLKVTGIATGCAPGALSVMVPAWVPTPREPRTGLMVTVPLPVPELGLRVNQDVLVVAFQFNIPPPRLLTVSTCGGGGELPC